MSTIEITRVEDVREGDRCSVEGCGNGRDGRSRMCSGHRSRVKVHGDPLADKPLRKMGSGGVKRHPLYITWKGIKARVYDASSPSFHNYGGRGISMAPEWVNDSRAFLDWVDANLGPRPDGYSLDRIDNDGDYEPGNLRWASASQQQFNTRKDGSEGIVRRPNGRFQVWIKRDGERLTVGTFDTFEEAVEARHSALTPDLPTEPGSVIVASGDDHGHPFANVPLMRDRTGYWFGYGPTGNPITVSSPDVLTAWTPARIVPEDQS